LRTDTDACAGTVVDIVADIAAVSRTVADTVGAAECDPDLAGPDVKRAVCMEAARFR
jgi:hypothetical protein